MSVAATLPWEQYQALPLAQRKRPLTAAEYAALTRQQRIAAGLEDDEESAPADFNGAVFPNPDHLRPQLDTEPPMPVTRLPEGVAFEKGNYAGGAKADVSNPATADVLPEMGREIQAKMSTPALTPDQFMAQQTATAAHLTPDSFMAQQGLPPEKPAPPSAAERLGSNFLSGLGVTSDEQAKNFFRHPLDTVIKSFQAQGELAKKAKEAYDRGDYMEALQHSLNYMVPFLGQQTDQAGDQLKEGDIAGGVGRTLGAAVPIVAGSPEVQAAGKSVAASAAETGARAVRTAARGANVALEKAPGTIGGAAGAAAGAYLGGHVGAEVGGAAGALAGKELLPTVRIPGEGFGLPNRVIGGPRLVPPVTPEVEPPAPSVAAPVAQSAAAPAATSTEAAGAPAARTLSDLSGSNIPRTFSGESALRQVLAGQDTPNLMKIAKSRGINVAQESQLKPSLAGPRLINKIIDDFSADELDNMRDSYLENTRMGKHNFGDIGREAWKTMGLQAYFPDVKIPVAQVLRTQKAIASAAAPKFAPLSNLAGDIRASVAPEPAPAVAAAAPKTLQDLSGSAANPVPAPAGDLMSQLQQSLKQAQEQGVKTTATPASLAKRWGVDENSLAIGREQTRGMSPVETEADLAALAEKYKKGEPVEPIIETRDAQNNIISVDGRARALAARRAGVKRIPIIVRRAGTSTVQ